MADTKKTTNSKPIPHIPLPFKETIQDVLKVKPQTRDAGSASKKNERKSKEQGR